MRVTCTSHASEPHLRPVGKTFTLTPTPLAQLEVIFGLCICLVICFGVFKGVELDTHRHFCMLHSNMLLSFFYVLCFLLLGIYQGYYS